MGVSVLLSSTGEAPEDMGANPNQKPARKNRFAVKRGVIPPSSQVLLFHPDQWEKLVEAACLNRPLGNGAKYAFVKQLGGAGDGGRDVEARLVPNLLKGQWDLYQGKHYDHGLTPSDVFKELVKFFKHLAAKTYPEPRYYFPCRRLRASRSQRLIGLLRRSANGTSM